MSELKFANTKWDARTWTEEQKIQWQEKAFELGYTLGSKKEPSCLDSSFFFLEDDGCMTQERRDIDYFYRCKEVLKTFEDMFTEEVGTLESEVETKQSVFTHLRWVTASNTLHTDRGIGETSITEGKDYKVYDVVYEGGELHQYIICNDGGIADTYHISHFYKVTPEECTYLPSMEEPEAVNVPSVVISPDGSIEITATVKCKGFKRSTCSPSEDEECDGFDNLTYCKPDIPNLKYWYIFLKDLSQEQIDYIGNYFCTDRRWSFGGTENILMYQPGNCDGEYVWTNTLEHCDTKRVYKVSFNDIFKEVN